MNKLTASFTLLNQWSSGNWKDAINSYFRLDKFTSRAMAEGKEYHEQWAKEVLATNRLPTVFDYPEHPGLVSPKVEETLIVSIQDWLEIKGVIDERDGKVIRDWKTGASMSEEYANSYQMPLYGVLCTMKGELIERGEIHHYNQHTEKKDVSTVWLTDKLMQDSLNWAITVAGEIHSYFTENELYEKFSARRKL